MIKTRADLDYYISEDMRVYGRIKPKSIKDYLTNWLFPDRNFEFMKALRHLEYYMNGGGKNFRKLFLFYYQCRHSHWMSKTMCDLQPNTAGPGLHVSHGKKLVSALAKLGANCKINSDVTIGGAGRYDRMGAPQIGNRVYIGTGARILGDVHIADDVVIGANAVVTKDITEPNTTWVGIPARKISNHGSAPYLRLPSQQYL